MSVRIRETGLVGISNIYFTRNDLLDINLDALKMVVIYTEWKRSPIHFALIPVFNPLGRFRNMPSCLYA